MNSKLVLPSDLLYVVDPSSDSAQPLDNVSVCSVQSSVANGHEASLLESSIIEDSLVPLRDKILQKCEAFRGLPKQRLPSLQRVAFCMKNSPKIFVF